MSSEFRGSDTPLRRVVRIHGALCTTEKKRNVTGNAKIFRGVLWERGAELRKLFHRDRDQEGITIGHCRDIIYGRYFQVWQRILTAADEKPPFRTVAGPGPSQFSLR